MKFREFLTEKKKCNEESNIDIIIDNGKDKKSISQVEKVLTSIGAKWEQSIDRRKYIFLVDYDSDILEKLRNVKWRSNIHIQE